MSSYIYWLTPRKSIPRLGAAPAQGVSLSGSAVGDGDDQRGAGIGQDSRQLSLIHVYTHSMEEAPKQSQLMLATLLCASAESRRQGI